MGISDEELRRRRARLRDALDQRFDGNSDKLGKALGYKDGAFVRQMLGDNRTITEKTVGAIEALPGMAGWFAVGPWPFERVARSLFDALTEREKGAVEDAMLEKIHSLNDARAGKRKVA